MTRTHPLTRKEIRRPDRFIETFGKIRRWISKNRRGMIVGGVLGVVLVLGFAYYEFHKIGKENEAATLFAKSYQQYQLAQRLLEKAAQEEKEALSQEEGGEEGSEPPLLASSIDPTPYFEAAKGGLSELLEKYPHSSVAALSALYLGAMEFEEGNFDRAAEFYRKAVKSGGSRNRLLRYEARLGLAKSLEAAQKFDEAIPILESLRESDAQWLRSIVLETLFRIYLRSGLSERAEEILGEAREGKETLLVRRLEGIGKLYPTTLTQE